ncbi:MAG: ABC transporter permease, partial [Solirubrobacteraceae bacterium]
LGRDMFARVITGSRDILIIAVLADVLGTVAGTILGLLMGYFRGVVDDVLGRIVEAFLALPLVIVGILGTIALGGASTGSLIIIIAIVFTPLIARTVRAAVLIERDLDYVSAAKLRGESSLYIMFSEILPNIMPPIVVEFTVRLSYAIFTIVALSFLGFGIQPPSSDWGLDISNNYGQLSAGYWWEVLFDALAIATLVIGVNMVSTSVESALEG